MTFSRVVASTSVLTVFVALSLSGCSGGGPDSDRPTRETTAPIASTTRTVDVSATCVDGVAGETAVGLAEFVVAVMNGSDIDTLSACSTRDAITALTPFVGVGTYTFDRCMRLPDGEGTATFCWVHDDQSRASMTLRIKESVGSPTLQSVTHGGSAYDEIESFPTMEGLAQLPVQPVTVRDQDGNAAPISVQRFADDIYGDPGAIGKKCWTMAPENIDNYFATSQGRGAVLDALAHPLAGAQTGVSAQGSIVNVYFSWSEYESPYACPRVDFAGRDQQNYEADYVWMVERLAARLAGAPVSPHDTEANYPLYCSNDPGGYIAQDGTSREVPPTATDTSAVDAAVAALAGQPLSARRDPALRLTLVGSQTGSDQPMLVWYDVVGGQCLGDVWN